VTTFFLKHEIDTGDVIFREKMPIGEDENIGEIHDKMMVLGADALLKTVKAIDSQSVVPQPQPDEAATHAPKIFHETCQIDFSKTVGEVHNFVRGLSPYPTAWTVLDDLKLKIFKTAKEITPPQYEVGKIVSDGKSFLKVACTDGYIHLLDVQMAARKRMLIRDFLNGYHIAANL
jgi:methionyl-tRNA formyltransferase